MKRLDRERLIAIVLIIPSILAVTIFVYSFIGFTIYVSFSNWKQLLPDFSLVGLQNYIKLFTNPRFQIDLRNTVVFTLFFLGACLTIGFTLAVLLDQHIRGENLFRTIYLYPMAISFIVTGVAWRWLLNPGTPETGSIGVNFLLEKLGLDFLKWGWYTEPSVLYLRPESSLGKSLNKIGLGLFTKPQFGIPLAIISLVIAATWQMSGYTMALYLAGLRAIPDEIREAARVDGASEFQMLRYIIIPLLRPVTLSCVIILGHISLKIYDLVVAMTGPGPGFATDVPAYFMWETTFQANRFNQGSAIATILLLMVATLIIPYLIYSIRKEAEL